MKSFFSIALASMILPLLSAQAAPKVASCISKDSMVKAELNTQAEDSEIIDLKISSSKAERPAESTFPTQEKQNQNEITYFLSDTDFALLTVNLSTGEGKLSNGQFFGPKPFIDVLCK